LNGSGNFVQGMMAGDRVSRRCGGQIGAGLQEVLPLMCANMWKPGASDKEGLAGRGEYSVTMVFPPPLWSAGESVRKRKG